MPVKLLLKMGKRVASTDYAVRFYYNPRHKKFYKNKGALKKCIRRAWSIEAFNHREQLLNILEHSNCGMRLKEKEEKLWKQKVK